jgi:hypothetical protein
VFLGKIADCDFYIGAAQFEYWQHTQLIIDVVPGRGSGFSAEAPEGVRFLTRSRIFTDEVTALEAAGPSARAAVGERRATKLWRGRPLADQVNLDQSLIRKPGHTDAGAGRKPVDWKIAAIRLVHGRIVFVEARQIDARHHDMFETEPKSGKHDFQISHYGMRLGNNAVGQYARRFRAIRHLPRDKNEAVGFNGMAERRDRLRAAGDHVKFQGCFLIL